MNFNLWEKYGFISVESDFWPTLYLLNIAAIARKCVKNSQSNLASYSAN